MQFGGSFIIRKIKKKSLKPDLHDQIWKCYHVNYVRQARIPCNNESQMTQLSEQYLINV